MQINLNMRIRPQQATIIASPLLRMDPDKTYTAHAFQYAAYKMNSRHIIFRFLAPNESSLKEFLASLRFLVIAFQSAAQKMYSRHLLPAFFHLPKAL